MEKFKKPVCKKNERKKKNCELKYFLYLIIDAGLQSLRVLLFLTHIAKRLYGCKFYRSYKLTKYVWKPWFSTVFWIIKSWANVMSECRFVRNEKKNVGFVFRKSLFEGEKLMILC